MEMEIMKSKHMLIIQGKCQFCGFDAGKYIVDQAVVKRLGQLDQNVDEPLAK